MKHIVLTIALALLTFAAVAQSGHRVEVSAQDNIKLPWGLKNLTIVDGRLYATCNGVTVAAATTAGNMYALQPDTLPHFVGETFDYVVRNPRDGRLYFSHTDDNGKYVLYTHVKNRGRKNVPVEVRTWHKSIVHPTFSPDGNTMVFCSSSNVGLGGYDLWCTFWNGKRWSRPVNMGNAINGPGNEICPVFYGNYLIYASDSVQNSPCGYNFYAVRMPAIVKLDNILFDAFKIQRLPFPINSDSNDVELAVDTVAHRGYWLTNRGGKTELYGFQGALDGVMVTGTVADEKHRPVMGAEVRIMAEGRVVGTSATDSLGVYRIFVQPGDDYLLHVSCPNYFTSQTSISAIRHNEDFLVAEDRHDVCLAYLPYNRTMIFDHIYRHGADVELSDEGKAALSPVADFVRDNPGVQMHVVLRCDQTTDAEFNNMIIERRINDLRQFFIASLPSAGQFFVRNGNPEGENAATGSGRNEILITLRNGDK